MGDDKPSKQMVMTPQLQLALRMLEMSQDELFAMIADWRDKHPDGLADLQPGDPDPISRDERELAEQHGIAPWSFPTGAAPLPEARPRPDVWVFGDPPQARANPAATPQIKPLFDDKAMSNSAADVRQASWLVRGVRQRAKMQEKIVEELLRRNPQMATAEKPDNLERVPVRDVAQAVGMHESTIEKVISVCRYQTIRGVVQLVTAKDKIAHRALW